MRVNKTVITNVSNSVEITTKDMELYIREKFNITDDVFINVSINNDKIVGSWSQSTTSY